MKNGFLLTIRILFPLYLLSVCLLCFLNLAFPDEMDIPHFILGIPVDKIVHFMMFLPYPLLATFFFSVTKSGIHLKFRKYVSVFLTGIVFAALTELIQKYLLPARDGDILDFLADFFGLVIGIILVFILYPFLADKISR